MPLPEQDRAGASAGERAGHTRSETADQRGEISSATAAAGKRIILIEDEALVAMELEATLSGAGYEVVGAAGNLEEAKRLIAEGGCDAALLDVNLGGRPVDELVAALKRRNVPFAFVTGYGRSALPDGCRDAIVVEKPFSRDRLIAAVTALLAAERTVVPLRQKKM